jgi:hypothetical protein
MSIASELDSTIENIKSDYEGLENLGADLTNVNKNIQNIRTCLDNIYTNLPKTTGEGTNLSLTTLKGRINVDDILGDTTQEGTPTPSNVEDINVVTGTQEVVVQNKNLFIYDTNGWISATGEVNSSSGNICSKYFKLKENTDYTLSANTTFKGLNFAVYDENKNILNRFGGSNITAKTINSGTTYKYGRCWVNYNESSITEASLVTYEVQLEIGSTRTGFVEHQEQTKTLHLGDIELGGIGNYIDRIFETSGKNLTDIVLDGSVTGEITYKTYTLQPNTQYTISTNTWVTSTSTANVFASSGTSFSPSSSSNGVNGSRTITSDNNGNITIGYRNVNMSMDYSSGKYWIMLNKGSTALPYEPYGSDNWYIEKNIGKVVLNGSQNIALNTSSPRRFNASYSALGLTNVKSGSTGLETQTNYRMCDHFRYESNNSNWGIYYLHNGWLVLLDSGSVIASANDLKTWFASNNTTILYVQEAPTYTEITNETLQNELNELEKMYSYNGQTNISVSGNLPMILDVSALKGE